MADEERGNTSGYVTVEIYDQTYHLSGEDTEHVRQLAARVDAKMRAVAAQGRTVDSLRVAVLAALNFADELTQAGGDNAAAGGGSTEAGADAQLGHERAVNLRELLDEVLEEDREIGS